MKSLGWSQKVEVSIKNQTFVRELSVRAGGKTVALALPCNQCTNIEEGEELIAELRNAEDVKRFNIDQLSDFPVKDWVKWPRERQTKELDKLIATYRTNGFPWSAIKDRAEPDPLSAVARSSVRIEDDMIVGVGYAGQRTCAAMHLHRVTASCGNSLSILQAFETNKYLRRALEFQLEHGDPVVPVRLLRALSALTHGPMNFAPALARWLTDEYAPEGGRVLDPCSGYGGRLLGSLASAKGVKYYGADIEPASVEANLKLAAYLGASRRVVQELRAIEDEVAWPEADLAIVGPPYYNRENYGEASQKALANYPTYGAWVEGFLKLLLRRTMAAVPLAVFNVAAIREGTTKHDIPGDLQRLAVEEGLRVARLLKWRTAKFNAARIEYLIVLSR